MIDIKVMLDLDELIKCIIEKRLPEGIKVFSGLELPEELKEVSIAIIANLG
jgi:hypothetical protein